MAHTSSGEGGQDYLFFQIGRRIWQGFFLLAVLGLTLWLPKNFFMGNIWREWDYFVSASILAAICMIVLYVIGFRAKRELFVNFHISLGTLTILMLVFEMTIRVWDHFDPIFRPPKLEDYIELKGNEQSYSPYKPNSSGATHGNPVRINSLGFRGPEISIPKPGNSFRIIVLGDSYTFGQGVAESEIYTSLLGKKLSARYQGKRIEVINLGVMGVPAIYEMNLLHRLGSLLEPDFFMIGFVSNDVREGNWIPDAERLRWALPIPQSLKNLIISYFKSFRWLTEKYDEFLRNLGVRPDGVTSLGSAYDPDSEEWSRFVGSYENIIGWTREHGIAPPLVGLLLPAAHFYGDDWIQMGPQAAETYRRFNQVEHTLLKMGFHTINYLPYFQRENRRDMTVSKWEGHPNALAHSLYAEGFFDSIVGLDLIH